MPAYIGVNGKAKGIAKVYKGDSKGKAQLIWGPKDILRKYDVAISEKPYDGSAAASVGEYALLGSGLSPSMGGNSNVIAYNSNLTETTLKNALTCSGDYTSATNIGNYAIFSPGDISGFSPSAYTKYGDKTTAIDTTLTVSNPAPFSDLAYARGAASNGKYAIFAGGQGANDAGDGTIKNVEAYNSSLTKVNATSLSTAVSFQTGGSIPNKYAIFVGGNTDGFTGDGNNTSIRAYDQNLTASNLTNITMNSYDSCAVVSAGDNLVVLTSNHKELKCYYETYDKNLTVISKSALNLLSDSGSSIDNGISLNGYAIIRLCQSTSKGAYSSMIVDENLVISYKTSIDEEASYIPTLDTRSVAATVSNKYALFFTMKEYTGGNRTSSVYYFWE